MFNLNKDQLQEKSDDLAYKAIDTIDDVAQNIKSATKKTAEKIVTKTDSTKDQANNLINSIKDLINQYTDSPKVNNLKSQIGDKAVEMKNAAGEEIVYAYETGLEQAATRVRNNPVATLALAAGVGVLVGYVLGAKQTSK